MSQKPGGLLEAVSPEAVEWDLQKYPVERKLYPFAMLSPGSFYRSWWRDEFGSVLKTDGQNLNLEVFRAKVLQGNEACMVGSV